MKNEKILIITWRKKRFNFRAFVTTTCDIYAVDFLTLLPDKDIVDHFTNNRYRWKRVDEEEF
jgi:hypothetical protein